MPKSGRMKNQNRNRISKNQTIILKPITPHPEPVVIDELLTLTEIEAVIDEQVVLSDAVTAALAVCKGDLAA
jgi:hypothetical protein